MGETMAILLGIVAYFGLALFVGRFLALSTRGEVIYSASATTGTSDLYEPAETVNLSVEGPPPGRRTNAPERAEEKREGHALPA